MKQLLCSLALPAALLILTSRTHAETPALPSGALKTYCAAAGDTSPATFGDGRNAPAIEWRCVHGAVYVCETGAYGVACGARSRSRVPLPSMITGCRDYGQLAVASGALGFVWAWECRGGKPVIVGPAMIQNLRTGERTPMKFDAQGYAEREWSPIR